MVSRALRSHFLDAHKAATTYIPNGITPPVYREAAVLEAALAGPLDLDTLTRRVWGDVPRPMLPLARKSAISMAGFAVVLGLTWAGFSILPGGFLPDEDQGYFFINASLPDGSSLDRTNEVTDKINRILDGTEGVAKYLTVGGYSMLDGVQSPNAAMYIVTLDNWNDRPDKELWVGGIMQTIQKQLFGIQEAFSFCFIPPPIMGLGSAGGFSLELQDRGGAGTLQLQQSALDMVSAAQKGGKLTRLNQNLRGTVPMLYLDIDRVKAQSYNLRMSEVFGTLSTYLGSSYVNDFNRFGRLYKAYIQAENEYRQSQEQINLFFVKNKDGQSVPLSAFVEVQDTVGPDYTNRYNLYRSVELSGGPAPGYTSAQALDALEEVAAQVLPRDMGYEWSNMSYQEKKAAGSGAIVFVFSMVFVFLILAALYESWSLPWSILLGTPFAIFGALATVLVARQLDLSYENNVFAQISLVMLIGMAAKNAILIVEFANIKFNEGLSLFEAAMESAKLRFRPILMTAFSFILGIFPLVVATGAGAEARKVMGMTVFSGMLAATCIGVVLVPALFVLVDKLIHGS